MISALAWIMETVLMVVGGLTVGSWLSTSWVGIIIGTIGALALFVSGLRRRREP